MVPFEAPEALEKRLGVRFHLRLGANESLFGPSPAAIEAMRERAATSFHYGDPQSYELRHALAERFGIRADNVCVASGIDELLSLATRLFVAPGEFVVTSVGTYPTFDFAALGAGADVRKAPYRNDAPDVEALAEEARHCKARLVYLANPDNPTGALLGALEVARLREALPHDCVLLLDEAYSDFAPVGTLPKISGGDPGVLRLRTFSKAYGMAGARIGYVIAHDSHIRELDKIRLHFGVNAVAQAGALASLSDDRHLNHVVAETSKGRRRLREVALTCGFETLPSATNFVAIDFGTREKAEAVLNSLLQKGVFVRKPSAPPLDRLVRITIGRSEDLDLFEEIFPTVL